MAGRWGCCDQRYDEVDDLARARNVPSMQLVGSPGRTVDLNALSSAGVRRSAAWPGSPAASPSSPVPPNVCALADRKLGRLLNTIDAWRDGRGGFAPTVVPRRAAGPGPAAGQIAAIVWATGYRPDSSWLEVPVLDGGAGSSTTAA